MGHSVESDDILMASKSVGESPMKPLGTNSSLTKNGIATGPPSAAGGGPPWSIVPGGGVEPGAEHARRPAAKAARSAVARTKRDGVAEWIMTSGSLPLDVVDVEGDA